ncbi:MAG: gamma-glutamyltransferase [Candidatus Promineifilaceae bacterium]|nr:gamma-glutamyltransferase [Candidatus Promineifilaceae bacterium]
MQTRSEKKKEHYQYGVIAAGGPETAEAGMAMLKQGGNAVDAAVAAAFASFIAEIGVVHLGGSGMAHIYNPDDGHSIVYDFFSNSPGLDGPANPPEAMDFSEITVDFGETTQNFHLGRASVAVPGNIFGLCRMAKDHGRLPLATLLQPAIKLAEEGLEIAPFQANTCKLLTPLYTHTTGMRAIFLRNGRMIQPGEHLYIPDLTRTLIEIAADGEQVLRNGRLAHALLDDQAANGGLLTARDLQHYQVLKLPSIRVPYRDYEILLPPRSSTGGVLTAFTMNLLAHFNVSRWEHGTLQHLRRLYEIMAATSRARPIWEKLSVELPVEEALRQFLSKDLADQYEQEIREALAQPTAAPAPPEPAGAANTSHLSVMDSRGMSVSLTTTAGESAGYVVPGTGFIPNNIMGEEDLHPLGFHTRPPGRRIPTMMTPAIVLCNNQPRVVVGSGGSVRIRSAIMQVLSNLLDFGMGLHKAVNAPRVHIEDGVLQCEAGYNPEAVSGLEALGYAVNRWQSRSIYFGGAHSVSRTKDGRLFGAGDNRRGGATIAF